jgi:phospholipid/cholesterol/gamma-HCH transport system permease protein
MPQAPTGPATATLSTTIDDAGRLVLGGALTVQTLTEARSSIRRWMKQRKRSAPLDLKGIESLDTPGALVLTRLREDGVEFTGIRPDHKALLELVGQLELKPLAKPRTVPRWRELVINVGKRADKALHDAYDVVSFVALAANAVARALAHPGDLRLPSISRQIAETGVTALPIVGLMAVMISVVIGYQGVAQLRPYGGEDFTVNLVAVSMLREMGVLITAIMVAGRSGSAFTAEIGVMEAREEVDALKVMGINPIDILVVPRVLALILTLPLLTFFSDIMGLVGGAVISQWLLEVSPLQYIERVHSAVDGRDLFVGIVKAPVFAFFIAVVGCMHGLRVRGSAESVGRETTSAVVKSIFLVIVLDALFSILFERLGL